MGEKPELLILSFDMQGYRYMSSRQDNDRFMFKAKNDRCNACEFFAPDVKTHLKVPEEGFRVYVQKKFHFGISSEIADAEYDYVFRVDECCLRQSNSKDNKKYLSMRLWCDISDDDFLKVVARFRWNESYGNFLYVLDRKPIQIGLMIE